MLFRSEALGWALSWYEGMDLGLLVRKRQGSHWIEDPEHVQRRQERAFEIAKYAETRFYIEGDDVSVPDEDEEAVVMEEEEVTSGGEEARDAGAGHGGEDVTAGSGAAEDEDDDVDEHNQVGDSPSRIAKEKALAVARARRAAALGKSVDVSADESLRLAFEIGAKAASEAAATASHASE